MRSLLLTVTVLFSFSTFATGLNWMQGHWIGCEDGYTQEKAITSDTGGVVLGANKILKDGKLVQNGFIRVEQGANPADAPTITFYSGTAIVNVAKCKRQEVDKVIGCEAEKGGFSTSISLIKGTSAEKDHLLFVHTIKGVDHSLDMTRVSQGIPNCGSAP